MVMCTIAERGGGRCERLCATKKCSSRLTRRGERGEVHAKPSPSQASDGTAAPIQRGRVRAIMQEPDDDADVPTVTLTDVLSGTVRERASDARRPSQQLRHLFKADAQQDERAACARYVRRCLGHPVLPTWPEAAAREALMRAVAEELGVEEAAPLYPHPGDAAPLRGALADVEAQLASCRTARRVAADEASARPSARPRSPRGCSRCAPRSTASSASQTRRRRRRRRHWTRARRASRR